MKRAIFFDRDGVINKTIVKNDIVFSPRKFKEFKLIDEAKEVLDGSRKEGFVNIIVTNQPDIRRGMMGLDELECMHNFIRKNLAIDDIIVCPHDDDDNCTCRKPGTGMFFEAAKKWGIELNASFLIGDQWKDVEAGRKSGCITVLIDYSYNKKVKSDFRASDLRSALKIILKNRKKG